MLSSGYPVGWCTFMLLVVCFLRRVSFSFLPFPFMHHLYRLVLGSAEVIELLYLFSTKPFFGAPMLSPAPFSPGSSFDVAYES